jgi:hypothetical protein
MFKLTRISHGQPMRIFFNALGRSLEFNGADASEDPGTPQDVSDEAAKAILEDEGLAPHFRCEPYPPAVGPEDGPAASAAAEEGMADTPASRRGRHRESAE